MRSMRFGVGLLLPLLSLGSANAAGQEPRQQTTTTAPPKEQPPPIFPRHRRGVYKNVQGEDVVDATPQSPPLETDDPAVPDQGEWEINLSTFADLAKDAQRVHLLFVDANYGLLPKFGKRELPTQLKMEFPLSTARTSAEPFAFGVGAAKLGLKFNFYTNAREGLSISVYPQLEFEPPSTRAAEKGLSEPGQTLILPVLVSKELHYLTFVANGGLEKFFHNPEEHTQVTFGVGFGRAITRKSAAMVEVRGESAFESGHRLLLLNAGVIRGIRHVVVYAKVGRSLASTDDVSHTYLGLGMKLLIPEHEK